MTEQKAGEIAQTLDRGLQVLEAVGSSGSGISATELAQRLGLHRSITARLLTTLLRRGYVARVGDSRYVLGLAAFTVARQVSGNLLAVATPLLVEISDRLDATAVLHVADGDQAVTLASIEPNSAAFRVGMRPGSRNPLPIAAHGLAILGGRPPRHGERPELAKVRKAGYAVTTGEVVPGFTGISAPVYIGGRCDASVGIVIPQNRKHDEKALAREVLALSERLSAVAN